MGCIWAEPSTQLMRLMQAGGLRIPRTSICLAGKGLGSMARVVVAPRRIVMKGVDFLVVVTGRWVMNSEAFVCVLGSECVSFISRDQVRAVGHRSWECASTYIVSRSSVEGCASASSLRNGASCVTTRSNQEDRSRRKEWVV